MALRCTAKALSFARIPRRDVATPEPDDDDWYANLLFIDRRKCLLVTHAATAFSAVALDVRAADGPNLRDLARDAIRRALAVERLAPDALGDLEQTTAIVAPTASRRVLGLMNEIAFHVRVIVAEHGGPQRADPSLVARGLQRTLHTYPEGYDHPLDRARARAGGASTAPPEPVGGLVLRIDLEHMPHPVWRRIQIPARATLDELEQALMLLFRWDGYHLSAFFDGGPWRGASYARRELLDHVDGAEPSDVVTVDLLLGAPKRRLHWLYDFGDGWQHRITCEELTALADDEIRCTAGRNAAPPEDCGGPPGFAELLAAIGDPDHPQHDELTEWLGAPFDPTTFDLELENRILRRLPGRRRRR